MLVRTPRLDTRTRKPGAILKPKPIKLTSNLGPTQVGSFELALTDPTTLPQRPTAEKQSVRLADTRATEDTPTHRGQSKDPDAEIVRPGLVA